MIKIAIIYYLILTFSLIILISCIEGTVTIPPLPQPTARDSVWWEYFPNTSGTSWIYSVKTNSLPVEIVTVTIEKRVLLSNNESASKWIIESAEGNETQFVSIVGDTVKVYTDINDINNPKKMYFLYWLPLDIYRNWNIRVLEETFGSDRASGGSAIGSMVVAAGTFKEVYEIERITDAQDLNAHEWINFVPMVGIIKKEILDHNSNDKIVWELQSYKIK